MDAKDVPYATIFSIFPFIIRRISSKKLTMSSDILRALPLLISVRLTWMP